jgi:electron transfer flavoprotein alpha/beta subunit
MGGNGAILGITRRRIRYSVPLWIINCCRGTVEHTCFDQIFYDVTEVKVDAASHQLRLDGVPEKIGNIDKNAVEAAIRLQEKAGGSVKALCFGPLAAREAFRDVLAMGVDEVTLIEDPFLGNADGRTAAQVLAAAITKMGAFDLVICGFASDDGYTYQVGPRVANVLTGRWFRTYALCRLKAIR